MNSQPAAIDAGLLDKGATQLALSHACMALWLATLSLMTAFMQTQAPAHRYLMARRIARNFGTLREQDCFERECRKTFTSLEQRWNARADRLAISQDRPRGGFGLRLVRNA